jgi:Cys-rich repeat protein
MKYTLMCMVLIASACGTLPDSPLDQTTNGDAITNSADAGTSLDAVNMNGDSSLGSDDASVPPPPPLKQSTPCATYADCAHATDQCVFGLCASPITCWSNKNCSKYGLKCDVSAGQCVQCVTNTDCPSGDTCSSGHCVVPTTKTTTTTTTTGCTSNATCSAGTVCNTTTHACVQCVSNADCPSGDVCQSAMCVASTTATTTTTTTTSTLPAISLAASFWSTVFDGYGFIIYDAVNGIQMAPKASTQPSETHATLTLAQIPALKDFHLTATATTQKQLRTGSTPNTWETFWIFFNYQPTQSGKNTNYFVLKTNGVELGTATDVIGQQFLATGGTTAKAVGVANDFDIVKIGNHVTVKINGQTAVDYTGALFDVAGSIGLYSEDAQVLITSVRVTAL